MKNIFSVITAASIAIIASSVIPIFAQSGCAPIYYGNVLTPAQWQSCFSQKQDALNFTPVNRAGDTMTGRLVTAAPGATTASFNFTPGTAPASPVNGDVWATAAGLYTRIGGATILLSVSPGRLSFSSTVNFNTAGDTPIALALPPGYTRFLIANVVISGANHSLTTATAGLFTGAGGTGVAIVTAASSITVSTGTDATNNNAQAMSVNNQATQTYTLTSAPSLYWRVGTPEGAAATGTVTVTITPLP